jgi:hypothetical protein
MTKRLTSLVIAMILWITGGIFIDEATLVGLPFSLLFGARSRTERNPTRSGASGPLLSVGQGTHAEHLGIEIGGVLSRQDHSQPQPLATIP